MTVNRARCQLRRYLIEHDVPITTWNRVARDYSLAMAGKPLDIGLVYFEDLSRFAGEYIAFVDTVLCGKDLIL